MSACHRHTLSLSVTLLCACTLAAAAPSDLATGTSLLKKGNYSDARAALLRAYKKHPSDPRVKLAYARSLVDASEAEHFYRVVASDTTAADTLRSQAYVGLAGICYVKAEYVQAALDYERAWSFTKTPALRIRQAACALNADSMVLAESLLNAVIAADSASPTAAEARYHLGDVYAKQDSAAKAMEMYAGSITDSDSVAWHVPALVSAYTCAVKLGKTTEAQQFRTSLEKRYPDYLEKRALQSAASSRADSVTGGAAHANAAGKYTIQVGSFGTAVNAQKLRDKLAPDLGEIRIVPYSAKGTKFYRVWVGSFATRGQAEDFAKEKLTGKRVSYSVISE
jgi:TolA-binding protein